MVGGIPPPLKSLPNTGMKLQSFVKTSQGRGNTLSDPKTDKKSAFIVITDTIIFVGIILICIL